MQVKEMVSQKFDGAFQKQVVKPKRKKKHAKKKAAKGYDAEGRRDSGSDLDDVNMGSDSADEHEKLSKQELSSSSDGDQAHVDDEEA